jgi:hypothetical protein
MIVRSREDQLKALKNATSLLGDITFSSAYCSHYDPEFKDIIAIDEFFELHKKLANWTHLWEKKLEEINK